MNGFYQPYWENSDELEHFGILGMKWGIRRFQNKDGSLTSVGKQRYGSTNNKISKKDLKSGIYARADDEEITFPKGTKLYRMTYSDNDPDKGIYVTRSQMDRVHYKNMYSTTLMGIGKQNENPKENTYVTTEELRIPSFDTRREIFDELSKSEKIRKAIMEDIAVQWVRQYGEVDVSSVDDIFKSLKLGERYNDELLEDLIDSGVKYGKKTLREIDSDSKEFRAMAMSRSIGASDTVRNAYIDLLKKKGYNATVDDFGRKGLYGVEEGDTSEALIIFDKSSMNKKGSKEINSKKAESYGDKVELDQARYNAKIFNDSEAKEFIEFNKKYNGAIRSALRKQLLKVGVLKGKLMQKG